MNSKGLTYKALTTCLMVAIIATSSIFVSAAPGKAIGELTFSGDPAQVSINGEAVPSGRTLFSSNTIATDTTGATANFGKFGKIELAPATTISVEANGADLTATLVKGKVTALAAPEAGFAVIANEKLMRLAAGASATSGKFDDDQRDANGNCVDTDKDGKLECDDDAGSGAWWIWTLAFAGAAAGILFAALNDDGVSLGGGTTVVSPTR
jgi:hypothetical protein